MDQTKSSVDDPGGRGRIQRIGISTILIGLIALVAWLFLFAVGMVINSSVFRDELAGGHPPFSRALYLWIFAICSYTMTNILLLCCLAAILGEIGRRVRCELGDETEKTFWTGDPIVGALMRGFFVYLATISGIVLLVETPFKVPSPEQYVRLSGLVSLFSFMVGYKPSIFSRFFGRLSRMLEGSKQEPPERSEARSPKSD